MLLMMTLVVVYGAVKTQAEADLRENYGMIRIAMLDNGGIELTRTYLGLRPSRNAHSQHTAGSGSCLC
jgi:hypothetical protein